MKLILIKILIVFSLASTLHASVPTEEGLLKNLNNADLPGQYITVRMMIQPLAENEKAEYLKIQISLENNAISALQTIYSSAQMQNSQVKSTKYFPDLLSQIRREKTPEKSLFYAIMMMLTTNRSQGVELFLEKNGVSIVKNKSIINEDKIKLLRAYRAHLINNKGKGEAGSPLNPEDPKNKEKVLELFRSNTFKRAKNIELVKKDNEFMWKVDWKSIQGYFSNEERQFRSIDYSTPDSNIKIEASQYLLFNGINELPKFFNIKDSAGELFKIQTLGLDVKKVDRNISDTFEELRKTPNLVDVTYSFLF